jgi:hypothetical protein
MIFDKRNAEKVIFYNGENKKEAIELIKKRMEILKNW